MTTHPRTHNDIAAVNGAEIGRSTDEGALPGLSRCGLRHKQFGTLLGLRGTARPRTGRRRELYFINATRVGK